MVTAESKTENVIAAKKAGVNNYIVKPFNAQTLKAKIEAVFAEKIEVRCERALTPAASHESGVHHTSPRMIAFGATPAALNIAFKRGDIGRLARAVLLGMNARM